jgi:hypothetical protein
LGGDFTLDSTPGQGTRVTVELPLGKAEPAVAAGIESGGAGSAGREGGL